MPGRTILSRIERAEQMVKESKNFSGDCICFPENEPPFFVYAIEREIAAKLKCPAHGDRFVPMLHLYVSAWRREGESARRSRLSAQHQKAWLASFPVDLWPAEEEQEPDGSVFLRLKNGTKIIAEKKDWKRN